MLNNKLQRLSSTDMSVENDIEFFNQQTEDFTVDQNDNISLEIRSFLNIVQIDKSAEQLLKPYAVENLTFDADDVCNIAIIILRKLYGDDYSNFSLQILQIISDI